MNRLNLLMVALLLLNGCALWVDKPELPYHFAQMQHLQKQQAWFFMGRLALTDEKNSISASINWRHQPELDDIELTGPLAQGRVVINVRADKITVDDGEHRQEYVGAMDAILSAQLGVTVPAQSLRYWVLGVGDPQYPITELSDGFLQADWLVRFKELQMIGGEVLPKKISADKDKTRVKLVIDQWELL